MNHLNQKDFSRKSCVRGTTAICLITLFLMGCATKGSITHNHSKITWANGVNVKEAVYIAQKYCMESKECHGEVRISTPVMHDDDDNWFVHLWSKNIKKLDRAFVVTIEKDTGHVISGAFNK